MRPREEFLSRWSRLKRQGGEAPLPAPVSAAPPPVLPDPETLVFADDFSGFLHREVAEGIKRVALKKLFHSAEFNVMDGLDIYIDDYTLADPIDEATLRTLAHAKDLLFDTPPADEAVIASAAGQETPSGAGDTDVA